jgi:hypothetical protein
MSGLPAEFPRALSAPRLQGFRPDRGPHRPGFEGSPRRRDRRDQGDGGKRFPCPLLPGGGKVRSVVIAENRTRRSGGRRWWGRTVWPTASTPGPWPSPQGLTLDQVYSLDLAYAPPYSPVWDPVLVAADVAMKKVR